MEHATGNLPRIAYTLRDGTPVVLRPVTPEDRERMKVGFSRLSETTRYRRFFRAIRRLTEDDITNLIQVDQVDHVAWAIVDPTDPCEPGMGLGRFIRDEGDPETAEVAFVVLDDYHRRGVGTILLALMLVLAEGLGLRRLRGVVRPDNAPVLDWLRGLGAEEGGEPGVVHEFTLPVGRPISRTPAARAVERIKRDLRGRLQAQAAGSAPDSDAGE